MKLKTLLYVLLINSVVISTNSQTYDASDTTALKAIDRKCDKLNLLNWNTEFDPAKWAGVAWDNSVPKRVTGLTVSSRHLIDTLKVTGLSALNFLNCPDNQLSGIEVFGLNNLEYLVCNKNQISTLNLSGLTHLGTLACYSNKLTQIDVVNLTNLTYIECYENQLTSLDISNLTNLNQLICTDNLLTSLIMKNNSNLARLEINHNKLTSLDLSGLTELSSLSCHTNKLTSLDLSLPKLVSIVCSKNKLPFSSLATAKDPIVFGYSPQDTLYNPLTIAGNMIIDYSSESVIDGIITNFVFYKNGAIVESNNTGLFTTTGAGVYHCKMTNAKFTGITLTTAVVTVTSSASELSVAPTILDLGAGANNSATFNVTSNTGWNISSSETWLTLSSTSGSNNGIVTVTATTNPSSISRTATVTVSGIGMTAQTVIVTQTGASPALTVSSATLNLNAAANSTATFTIFSNVVWNVSSNDTWLIANSISGSNDGTITLTVSENTSSSTRSATVNITGTGGIHCTIKVTQAGTGLSLLVSPVTLSIDALSGSSSSINVTSNMTWAVISDQTWLTINPASGSDNGTVAVTATENTSDSARSAKVMVSGMGVASQIINVAQAPASTANFTISATAVSVDAAASSTGTFNINSNIPWYITSSESWLTVNPSSGTNNGTIILTAEANPSTMARTAIVTVTGTVTGNVQLQITVTQKANDPTATTELNHADIFLYPNPCREKLNIELAPTDLPAFIVVYNIKGQQVMITQSNVSLNAVNMAKYNSGVYLIKVITPLKIRELKFVKQ
jgi:Leucine-rich repeat (LRR) protein